jgi:hypothetical protein
MRITLVLIAIVIAIFIPRAVGDVKEMAGSENDKPPNITLRKELTAEQKIKNTFGDEGRVAVAIFKSESGLDRTQVSNTDDYGIGQINYPTWCEHIPGKTKGEKIMWLFNEDNNIQFAKMVYDRSGSFNPWTNFRNGEYKKYL